MMCFGYIELSKILKLIVPILTFSIWLLKNEHGGSYYVSPRTVLF